MTVFGNLRNEFHLALINSGILCLTEKKGVLVASNADSSQALSRDLATSVAHKIASNVGVQFSTSNSKQAGQTSGNVFEEVCRDFVEKSFGQLYHLRPGEWRVEKINSRSRDLIGRFEQYAHLGELNRLASEHQELKNFLGDGYTVAPDVAVFRLPEPDEVINQERDIVGSNEATMAALRQVNHTRDGGSVKDILHASISCKFTMRSDRAQNTRTEALNLIRGRKGRVPHIVAITAEPTPSRLSSLAQGTGDIDCVYHFALNELVEAMNDYAAKNDAASDSKALLMSMINGKRLKDISDLPLDLSI
ncbi:NgoMIV family type II restriction endonuclease [Vibrio fortis]|uniref:NgoMIV family type II restriction endonuclease n=1 Tax=Vibrio fortis TaxID=212667 RepID=UPI0038CDAE03